MHVRWRPPPTTRRVDRSDWRPSSAPPDASAAPADAPAGPSPAPADARHPGRL